MAEEVIGSLQEGSQCALTPLQLYGQTSEAGVGLGLMASDPSVALQDSQLRCPQVSLSHVQGPAKTKISIDKVAKGDVMYLGVYLERAGARIAALCSRYTPP